MGCGKSAAEDDEIKEDYKNHQKIFQKRQSNYNQEKLEEIVSDLFRLLEGQQLSRPTWETLDNLRKIITRGTVNDRIFYRDGHWYRSI